MNTISHRLREERLRLGMTQTEFGKVGGVLKHAQLNYESGLRHPDTNYIERIVSIGADAHYILTGRRMAGLVLPEEMEVLKQDEREILMAYRKSSISIRNNIKAVIYALTKSCCGEEHVATS